MKKIAVMLLALSLLCGVLAGCGNDKGNIDDTDGVVTDSPRDDSIIDDADDILDGDDDTGNSKGNGNSKDNGNSNSSGSSNSGNNNGNGNNKSGSKNDDTAPTSIPGESPAVATQPVTP